MAETFYLGVDGGQSSTTALIGDENGVVIGYGVAGPSNHAKKKDGPKKLRRAVLGATKTAWGISPFAARRLPEFASAFFGMTGGPEDKLEIINRILRVRRLEVTHDAVTALMGATEGRPGIIVISGTGCIGFGMNAAGQTARAGGWGYIFGDEGSSFDIARQALRAALAQEEGWGRPTALREKILQFSGSADMNHAFHQWYTDEFPRNRVASFSRVVDEVARGGDRVARQILWHAALSLALLAQRVRRRIFKARDEVIVSYIGGAFQSEILRQRFRKLVKDQGANRVMAPALGPAAGALLAAYRAAGRHDVILRNLPPEG